MKILVTGGAGYIGSHCCVELLEAGHQIVCIDNLCNASIDPIENIQKITKQTLTFYNHDICDYNTLYQILVKEKIEACIHFAGLKSIAESIKQPEEYYRVNVVGTYHLYKAMSKANIRHLIYSSSATVYGEGGNNAFHENSVPALPTTPYGKTKYFVEQMLQDFYAANPSWSISFLRYFNPVGAHPSCMIGEKSTNKSNNLMPCILNAIAGERKPLTIYGDDYPTRDGTCVRDYIHVQDLAKGHTAALEKTKAKPGLNIYNFGRGEGITVKELVTTFEQTNKVHVPYVIGPRRQGDVHSCYADTSKANRELNWKASLGIKEMVRDAWAWHKKLPL